MLEMDGKLLGSRMAGWKKAGFDTSSLSRVLDRSPEEWVPAFMLFNTGVIAIQTLVERYEDPSDRELDERAIEILGWMTDIRDINRSLDGIMSALQAPGSMKVPPIVKKFFTDTKSKGLRAVLPENLFGTSGAQPATHGPDGPPRPIAPQVFDDGYARPERGPTPPEAPGAVQAARRSETGPVPPEALPVPSPPEAVPLPLVLKAAPVPPPWPPLTAEPARDVVSAAIGWESPGEFPRRLDGTIPAAEPRAAAGGPGDRLSETGSLEEDRYELLEPGEPPEAPECLVDTFERDMRSLFLSMRLVEVLLSKVDRSRIYELLERYERFGWISEDVRVSLMTMARGMRSSALSTGPVRISPRVDRRISLEQEIVQRLFFQTFAGRSGSRPMGLFLTEHSTVLWFLAKMANVRITEDSGRSLEPYVQALRRACSP